jgi:hypothetical protein
MPFCPTCKSKNSKRRFVVWEEGVGTVQHENGGESRRISALSLSHLPPLAPEPYLSLVLEFGLIIICTLIGVAISSTAPIPLMALMLLVIGAALLWFSAPRRARFALLLPSRYRNHVAQCNVEQARYQRQWVCRACGYIFEWKGTA